jgi:hypothetical protein
VKKLIFAREIFQKKSLRKRKFLIIAFLFIFLQFLSWPLVWHLIILPKSQPALHGFRVEAAGQDATSNFSEPNFFPDSFFHLDQPNSSLLAYAVWIVSREGVYKIRVTCDDNGQVEVDNRPVVFLSGISSHNQGEGTLWLTSGSHFLKVQLNNVQLKGWMKIEVVRPDHIEYQPIDIKEINFIKLGNIDTWLLVVHWIKIISLIGFIFFGFTFYCLYKKKDAVTHSLILLSAVLLSLFTVYTHVQYLKNFFETGGQLQRHLDVLKGQAVDPWQYRILATYLIEGMIQLFKKLSIFHSENSVFIFFRFLQGVAIFLLEYFYYKKLGLSTSLSLLGMSVLAWGMSYSNYGSDLHFSTYFDILFYLIAGLIILLEKPLWVIPLTVIASLNKESSGLIPIMLIASYLTNDSEKLGFYGLKKYRIKIITIGAISLISYLIIFFGLRFVLGPRPLIPVLNQFTIFELIKNNLFSSITWVQLFGTMSIIPIIAILNYKNWPKVIKIFFWVVIPIWIVIHTVGGVMAESRLFLVPLSLVFIPGALFYLNQKPK